MDPETAKHIVNTKANSPMDAIKMLRNETALGLYDAKNYIMNTTDPDALLKKICDEFVKSWDELLEAAVRERDLITAHIAYIEMQIAYEKEKVEKK